jgi:lysophospholipase L1-like esterase
MFWNTFLRIAPYSGALTASRRTETQKLISSTRLLNNVHLLYTGILFCLINCFISSADTLVVLGSSTAAGTGATVYDSAWVGRYAKYINGQKLSRWVLNLAVNGYTSYHILPTRSPVITNRPTPDTISNITRALKAHPAAIIVNMVANDIAFGYAGAEYLKNLDTVAAVAQHAGVPIWFCTIQPRNFSDTDASKRDTLKSLAQRMLVQFAPHSIDFWTGIADTDNNILPSLGAGDGIHLNNLGHLNLFNRVVAAHIPDTVDKSAAIRFLPSVSAKKAAALSHVNKYNIVNLLGKSLNTKNYQGRNLKRTSLSSIQRIQF